MGGSDVGVMQNERLVTSSGMKGSDRETICKLKLIPRALYDIVHSLKDQPGSINTRKLIIAIVVTVSRTTQ